MSLINDALKRAKEATQKKAPPPPSDPPLKPADGGTPEKRGPAVLWLGAIVITGLAVWYLLQWWGGRTTETKVASAPPKTNVTIATRMVGAISAASNVVQSVTNLRADASAALGETRASPPALATAPATADPAVNTNKTSIAASTNLVEKPAVKTVASAPESISTNAPTTATAAPTAKIASATNAATETLIPRPVAFPPLQLQGIYFRLTKPSVLINNRTLYIGDQIEGARVAAISRYSVTLEMRGKTNVLTLR